MASERKIEVVMSWAGTPHDVLEALPHTRVVIGDTAGASFLLPSDHVPSPIALLESDGSRFIARIPAGASARADRAGNDPLMGTDPAKERALEIDRDTRLEIEIGPFAFFLSESTGERSRAPLAPPDLASVPWIGLSLAVHSCFLVSLFFMPPSSRALSLDLTGEQREYVRTRLEALERAHPVLDHIPDPSNGGAEAQASAGEEGSAGRPEEPRRTGGRIRVRGASEDPRVPLTRERVASSSVIAAIQGILRFDVDSPFGDARAIGSATENEYGAVMADAAGFGPGTGGLGMQGVGRGGGCRPGQACGAGTIGVGDLASGAGGGGWAAGTTCTEVEYRELERVRGHAAARIACSGDGTRRGGGSGSGIGIGDGRRPDRESRVPELRCVFDASGGCRVDVAGGLAREQIQRVISRNRNQVRHCYEQALAHRPDLAGRLTIRWAIMPEGRVSGAQVAGTSDLASAEVEACVVRAIGRWQFPSSAGATMVSYPFLFESTN